MAEDKKIPSPEKLKALQLAMAKIDKEFGKGAIMKLGDDKIEDIPVIPSGSVGLNLALGVGGYPRGRVVEIYGPESSGKTTLAIHAMAEVQKQGGIAAIIDAEHAFDRFYAEKLGVDTENLLIAQPDCGEQALDIADELIRSAAVDLVVIDSVAALTPKAEIEGDMGDNRVGLQARLMSQALRKLTATINKTQTTCIFINQLREKIGVMFGNPETTTGGNALKFYASVRLDIRKASAIKDGEDIIGNQVRVKVVKNKVAPPFKKTEFDLMFNEGISRVGEIVDLGVENGILAKSGSWYSYDGKGMASATEIISQNDDAFRTKQTFETVIRDVLIDLVKVVCRLEGIEISEDEIEITMDYSRFENQTATQQRLEREVDKGITSKVEYRMKVYGETEEIARQKIQEIQQENPSIDDLLGTRGGE